MTDSANPSTGDPSHGTGGPTVLQVLPALDLGGAERAAIDVSRAVVEAGGRAIVATSGGALEAELLRTKATHLRLPLASKNPLVMRANARRLAEIVRREGVDLIHARSRAPAWSARAAARRTGAAFVTTVHAPYNVQNALKKRYNAIMSTGDRVIAISEFVARHVRETYGVGDDRLRVVPRGVDIVALDPARVSTERVATLATRWNLPDGIPVVMLPGRMARWKGHGVLIEAMAALDREDVLCLLVGVGAGRTGLRNEIEAKIREKGLAGRVVLIDRCDDMAAAYRLADVVVSASTDPEGFGRVAVEAQAMGVPVVATNHGAALETVEPGVTGWLVPPAEPAPLANAITAALELDEEGRVRLAAIARARVVERFTKTRMCAETLAVYRELIDWP